MTLVDAVKSHNIHVAYGERYLHGNGTGDGFTVFERPYTPVPRPAPKIICQTTDEAVAVTALLAKDSQ